MVVLHTKGLRTAVANPMVAWKVDMSGRTHIFFETNTTFFDGLIACCWNRRWCNLTILACTLAFIPLRSREVHLIAIAPAFVALPWSMHTMYFHIRLAQA